MTGADVPAQRRSASAGELYLLSDTELASAIREAHHMVEALYGERLRRATAAETREASTAHTTRGTASLQRLRV